MRPARLGGKLLAIRRYFNCSLAQMAEKLSNEDFNVSRTSISQYELNHNEPSLPILLKYARLAGISMDVLADDKMDLPERFK
ncbi:MAG TPA: helix-turn-helix transcriptional regulator [Pedobacter sp.]